jgi:hypothetical protein
MEGENSIICNSSEFHLDFTFTVFPNSRLTLGGTSLHGNDDYQ